jgi:predicted DNA-binding WGR domain protein
MGTEGSGIHPQQERNFRTMIQVITDIKGVEHTVDVMRTENLICTTEKHNKFWRGILGKHTAVTRNVTKPYVVVLRWGRVGTVGNGPAFKKFTNLPAAESYLLGRLKDKYNKGYVVSNQSIPHKAPNTIAPVVPVSSYKTNVYEWDLF